MITFPMITERNHSGSLRALFFMLAYFLLNIILYWEKYCVGLKKEYDYEGQTV